MWRGSDDPHALLTRRFSLACSVKLQTSRTEANFMKLPAAPINSICKLYFLVIQTFFVVKRNDEGKSSDKNTSISLKTCLAQFRENVNYNNVMKAYRPELKGPGQ